MSASAFDVLIVGGGPAGTTCALALRESGLRVALLDKASFPRDKICGDAIPGRAIKVLKAVAPAHYAALGGRTDMALRTHRSQIFVGRRGSFFQQWVNEAYTVRRMDWDNFLMEAVKSVTATTVLEGVHVTGVQPVVGGLRVTDGQQAWEAPIVIGADGAQSRLNRLLTQDKTDLDHHIAAVRGYYSDVAGLQSDTTEIYVHADFPAAYFWVFPVGEKAANVGVGMLSSRIAQKGVKLREVLEAWPARVPALAERLKNARLEGRIQGFGLPIGSKHRLNYGDHFMLVGDAAGLIDPLGGHGIDTAMLSGLYAAEQALAAHLAQDFSGRCLSGYDARLYAELGKTFRQRERAMRFFNRYPRLLSALLRLKSGW